MIDIDYFSFDFDTAKLRDFYSEAIDKSIETAEIINKLIEESFNG